MNTIKDRLKTLKSKEWLWINAPNLQFMLTGTKQACIKKDGTIQLIYTDGTTEEAKDMAYLQTQDADNPSLFGLVGCVQSHRMKTRG